MIQSCLIIAGEKSGEEHALSFFKKLRNKTPSTTFYGVGGDELVQHGLELIYHLKDFSSFGLSEVVSKIPFYFKAKSRLLDEVYKRGTKVAILIDFQDFNLRLAKILNKNGVKVLYYVAPQAWAWRASRCAVLAKTVHTLFTIIPFEKKWFLSRGVHQVKSVAHPLYNQYVEQISDYSASIRMHEPLRVCLLPGSRIQEVEKLLPEFLEAIKLLRMKRDIKVFLVTSSNLDPSLFQRFNLDHIEIRREGELVRTLKESDVCMATSGTVTLSCALFSLPTVVCYKVSWLTELIFYWLINYKGHISLANIVHNKQVFPELIQESVSGFNIASLLEKWIDNPQKYEKIVKELNTTANLLTGEDFDVAEFMAKEIDSSYARL